MLFSVLIVLFFLQVDDERVAEELFREQAGSAASQKTDRGSSSERDTDRWLIIINFNY